MASAIRGLQLRCSDKKPLPLSSPSSSSCSLIPRGATPLRSSLRLKPKSPGRRRSSHFRCIFLEPFLECLTGVGAMLVAKEEERKEPVTQEKLDDWIKDSISEIVRNIGEAPFLVHIFSDEEKGVRKEREAALPERWPSIKKRWSRRNCPPPDGIILVEELKYDVDDDEEEDGGVGRRSWGVVVQGRGMDCAACYILNTCRVRTSIGFCTHFCLVRAKAFGQPMEMQLKNAWLQQER